MNAVTWAVLTACVWGMVPLIEKAGLTKVTPLVGLFYRSLGVIFGLFLLGLFMVKPQEIKSVDLRSGVLLALGGFLASFVGQICFYNSLKIGNVSRVVPISGTYPLIAFILGIIFLGESITLTKLAGVVFVIAGIWALKIG